MRTLLIDNYDSYTYNLYQLIAATYGLPPLVLRNDAAEWDRVDVRGFDAIVISPGPGRPQQARDIGRAAEMIQGSGLPVLGVCLGHQLLALLAGGEVKPAPRPSHGMVDQITHTGQDLFAHLPQGFAAVRYHSLCVPNPLPATMQPLAWAPDGVLMGFRHTKLPWWGVQFHPESIGTAHGADLLRNFAALAQERCAATPAEAGPRADRPAPHTQRLAFPVDTETAFGLLFADSEYAFWLDSSRIIDGTSRFSFLGDAGSAAGEVLRYRTGTGAVEVLRNGSWHTEPAEDIFAVLRARLAGVTAARPPGAPFDFAGGYVGYFGYELRAECGSVPTQVSPYPDAMWLLASRIVVVDHLVGETWVLAPRDQDPAADAEAAAWVEATMGRLAECDVPTVPPEPLSGEPEVEPWLMRPREQYLADIQACLDQLRQGESYEICLTNALRVPFDDEPLALYRRLRRVNPAPYAAFLKLGEMAVLSSSPERFLRVDRDRVAESRPIKGTAPRDPDPMRDADLREALRTDPKTRAENLMIVDLLRNDLGTVSRIGSVQVPRFMEVESYATVHQLVTTVRGTLRPEVDALAAIRACFPGGSMTGAPKLRTMRIIDELEQAPRGVYSGALGYLSLTGEADLSIVIRTTVAARGELHIGAGGAIVMDSDPAAEYEEMALKARTSLRALEPAAGQSVGATPHGEA